MIICVEFRRLEEEGVMACVKVEFACRNLEKPRKT
jgi:hypothetical protein